jgi:hypothetical protein
MLLFFFDKTVRRYFDVQSDRAVARNSLERRLVHLQSLYQQFLTVDSDAGKHQRKVLLDQIKATEDEMHRL